MDLLLCQNKNIQEKKKKSRDTQRERKKSTMKSQYFFFGRLIGISLFVFISRRIQIFTFETNGKEAAHNKKTN